jgi:hypothetical protein
LCASLPVTLPGLFQRISGRGVGRRGAHVAGSSARVIICGYVPRLPYSYPKGYPVAGYPVSTLELLIGRHRKLPLPRRDGRHRYAPLSLEHQRNVAGRVRLIVPPALVRPSEIQGRPRQQTLRCGYAPNGLGINFDGALGSVLCPMLGPAAPGSEAERQSWRRRGVGCRCASFERMRVG